MAEAILQTGKRGEGKGLSAAKMMAQYLSEGRRVATNHNIFLEYMAPAWSDVRAYRLPDCPTAEDLEALPLGNDDPTQEEKNGLLCLDEVSIYLNAHDWQKDREQKAALRAWLAHSRKKGWDILLEAQNPRQVDAQIRESLCELHGIAKRLDKFEVPFLSKIFRAATGKPLKLPKIHVITYRYGFGGNAPKSGGDWFFGKDVYPMYDTLQVINADTGQQGLSSYLSPWHLKGRYMSKIQLYRAVALSSFIFGAIAGVVCLALYLWLKPAPVTGPEKAKPAEVEKDVTVTGVISQDGGLAQLFLSNGKLVQSSAAIYTPEGVIYEASGKRYKEGK